MRHQRRLHLEHSCQLRRSRDEGCLCHDCACCTAFLPQRLQRFECNHSDIVLFIHSILIIITQLRNFFISTRMRCVVLEIA